MRSINVFIVKCGAWTVNVMCVHVCACMHVSIMKILPYRRHYVQCWWGMLILMNRVLLPTGNNSPYPVLTKWAVFNNKKIVVKQLSKLKGNKKPRRYERNGNYSGSVGKLQLLFK